MKKTRKSIQIGLGVSSILMIFVVLCMMILSVLSFSRAKQSEEIAKREVAYEEAYTKATTKADLIYELIKAKNVSSLTMKEIIEQDVLQKQLTTKDITYKLDKEILRLNLKVNMQQRLNIIIEKNGDTITKTSWELTSIGGQENDND